MILRRYRSWHECMTAVTTSATEAEALSQDLLITVTTFFREPAAFQVLTMHAFPRILEQASPNEPVRVWVTGCATGEEVYSLAICWFEFLTIMHSSHTGFSCWDRRKRSGKLPTSFCLSRKNRRCIVEKRHRLAPSIS